MTIPADFPYTNTLLCGRPTMSTDFLKKHPPMPQIQRAKIFSPFDALDGFDETLDTKNVRYVSKEELSETKKKIIDERLRLLADLTATGTLARQNRVRVTASYFVPCADIYHRAYALLGIYRTVSGTVWEVDDVMRSILIGETLISFDDISYINGDIFSEDSEDAE